MVHRHASSLTNGSAEDAKWFSEQLKGLLGNNPFTNTFVMEALAALGALDAWVTVECASDEMRRFTSDFDAEWEALAASSREGGCESTSSKLKTEHARAAIGRIFEDIFQGAYWEAYEGLTTEERFCLLSAAASGEVSTWFDLDYVIGELISIADERALPIYECLATAAPLHSVEPQQAAYVFFASHFGHAKLSKEPPKTALSSTTAEQAWRLVGRLFWYHCHERESYKVQIEEIWQEIISEVPLEAVVVLREFYHCFGYKWEDMKAKADWIALYPNRLGKLAEHAISNWKRMVQLGKEQRCWHVEDFVFSILDAVGDEESAKILTCLADDVRYGAKAIAAIRAIRLRTA